MKHDRVVRSSLVGLGATVLLGLAGCREPVAPAASNASAPPEPPSSVDAPSLASVLIEGIPHVRQKPDFCGEACVEMAAKRLGRDITQDDVFAQGDIDPALGRGAVTAELARAVGKVGFREVNAWTTIDARDPGPGLQAELARVHADLARGVPSILCMHYDDQPSTTEHFRLVVGYDQQTDEIIFHEPAVDAGAYRRMSRTKLLSLWPLKYKEDAWTLIRIPLEPKEWSKPAPAAAGPTPADYVQHVRALKERIPAGSGDVAIRIEPPFVVIGDSGPAVLEQHATGTVRWAVSKLRADFFDAVPKKVLDVWLFGQKSSYERGVLALTGESPSTPYGFYSPNQGGLFMNISTGGGTLVHEIVHPFVEADFPEAPAWLNEGLGSLFEQSADRGGHIVGLTNWRLAGLQRAIRSGGRVPTFEALAKMSDREFYADDSGVHYAQARYLFYYMQEKGLLVPFYRQFRDARASDPSGYATLTRALGEADMADFQTRWQAYVLTLRYP